MLPFVGKMLTILSMLPDGNTNWKMLEKVFSYGKFIKWVKSDMMYKSRWKLCSPDLNWKRNRTGRMPFAVWE